MPCLFLLLLSWASLAAGQSTVDIAGVRFDERARIGAAEAQLNGAGVRSVFGFKFYAIGVYLQQRQDSPLEVLRAPGAKRIQIVNMFTLHGDLVGAGLLKAMRKNLGDDEFADLKGRIEQLRATVQAIERAPAGSVIQFDWLPAATGGVSRLSVNGLPQGEDIAGEDFFQALLKVWLGEKVNDTHLRDALLGRKTG